MRWNGAGGETLSPGFSPWIKAKPPTQTGKLKEERQVSLLFQPFQETTSHLRMVSDAGQGAHQLQSFLQ